MLSVVVVKRKCKHFYIQDEGIKLKVREGKRCGDGGEGGKERGRGWRGERGVEEKRGRGGEEQQTRGESSPVVRATRPFGQEHQLESVHTIMCA